MQKFMTVLLTGVLAFSSLTMCAQTDKSKRPSPPAQATATLASGATITIDYSQPAVKGRTVGKDLEPKQGEVWRTGANEATWIEFSKDVTVEGKAVKAGKYGLFTIWNGNNWTVIFNSKWNQMGAFGYKQADDVLRVEVPVKKGAFSERLTFKANNNGTITLNWADLQFDLNVK
jgi:D-Tyr-tRNAtyr deacylase